MSYPPPQYPPYPPPPPPLPGMYVPPHAYGGPPAPQRSGTPRVVGILAVVFACIGLLFALIIHFGPMSDLERWGIKPQAGALVSWMYGSLALSVAVFALHLIGGIAAISYKPWAPRLLTVYGVMALLLAVSDIVLSMVLIPDNLDFGDRYYRAGLVKESMFVRAFIEGAALPWPIVALALINTAGAKKACGATPT